MRFEIDFTATDVAKATNVVKLFTLTPAACVGTSRRVAIHHRIEDVQKLLGKPGKPLSVSALAKKAGFSRQTLGQIIRKSVAGTESGLGVLSVCADKWGVSFEWLAKGRGDIRPRERDPLELAIESEEWDAAAVAGARAMAEAGKRLGVAEWSRLLRMMHEASVAREPASATVRPASSRR